GRQGQRLQRAVQRGALRSGHRDMDDERHSVRFATRSHGGFVAQWRRAGRWGRWQQRISFKRGTLSSNYRILAGSRLDEHRTRRAYGDTAAERRGAGSWRHTRFAYFSFEHGAVRLCQWNVDE